MSRHFKVLDGGKGVVARAWDRYERMVRPADPAAARIAFFAGAACLHAIMLQLLDPDDEPTEAEAQRMQAMQDELAEWSRQFDLMMFGNEGDPP